MIKFPMYVGAVYTLAKDYDYIIAGEVVDIIKAGTKIFYEGYNSITGMYLYSC
jgi:hypothetical protein